MFQIAFTHLHSFESHKSLSKKTGNMLSKKETERLKVEVRKNSDQVSVGRKIF